MLLCVPEAYKGGRRVPEAYKAGVACCRLKLERLFQFRRILPSREKIQQPVLSPSGCGRLGTEPGRDPR
jgi:hypothetical protein